METAMLWLGLTGVGLGIVGVAVQIREFILHVRAERGLVRVLSERDEYRPVLRDLLQRQSEHGGRLMVSEHEVIDLREYVRQALIHLAPSERRQVEGGLYQPSARGREFYLLGLLSTSLHRLQHQG